MSESAGGERRFEDTPQARATGDDSRLRQIFARCRPDLPLDGRAALVLEGNAVAEDGLPGEAEWHDRIGCVFETIYNVFSEGRRAEAIRLGRELCDLVIDGEAQGLLALMLLCDGRIDEGRAVLAEALAAPAVGPYTLQAAIADLGLAAPVDWDQIIGLYDMMMHMAPSPAIAVDRAAAIAFKKNTGAMSNPGRR